MKKVLLCLLGLLFVSGTKLYAYDFHSGGIYYNILDGNKVEVTSGDAKYEGNIVIPEKVTYNGKSYIVTCIGYDAFHGCSNLTSITIPNSVTSIGLFAFANCSGLTSVSIPNSVTSIGTAAFLSCSGLTSVTIPNSVTRIGDRAFSGTAWYDQKADGLVYAGKVVYTYKGEIPSSISIEEGTLGIADAAFYGCSGLTSVTIPNSVTSIGDRAFQSCSGLTSVTIPNSVTSICYSVFDYCSGLTSISIPNSVTSIGPNAFSYCSGLTSISIPNSVTSIGSSAFHNCSNLTSITIPNSVTSIGSHAFGNCSGLNDVISEIKTPFGISETVFSVYSTAKLTVPNGTKSSYKSTAGWNKFTNIVEFTNSGDNTGTKRTIHVATAGTLPNLISESEKYNIEELTLTGELNGTDFRLIRDMAGNNYKGEKTAGKLAVLDFSRAKIVAGGDKYLDTNSGTFSYTVDKNDILPQHVFRGCKFISITIPSSVTNIGNSAFFNCIALTSIIIPNSVTSIASRAFQYCSGLTSITIPNSVTSIGDSVFYHCSGLTSITIPNSVTSIGSSAFENCSGLTYIIIPNSVTSIGVGAFSYSKGLTSITLSNSLTSIGNGWFQSCSGLTSITIPNSVTSIGYAAFDGCSGLTSITIPSSVTRIDNLAFKNCSSLTSIVSEIVKPFAISENVFSNYTKPTLTVPSGTKFAYQSTAGWKKFTNIVEASSGEWREVTKNFDKSIGFKKIRVKNTKTSSSIYCCVFFSTKPNDNTTSDTKYNINYNRLTIGDGVEQDDPQGYIYINTCKSIGDNWYEYEFKQPVYFSHYQSSAPTNQLLAFIEGTGTNEAVTVTAKSYTREYGDDNPSFEYTVSGGSISGTPKITCSATKTSAVGTYTIKIEEGNVTNSNVTFVDGTLTITKAPLTITAKSYTRKQGESNPTFDVTYSGFKNNETASVLTQKPTCFTTATSSSSPGTYDITVSGASATNYDISYVNGKLTVTQADAVIVTAVSYTREYGEDNPKFSYTTNGAALNGTPSITCSATKTSPVGTYPIKIVQGSVSNYNVTYVDGTLTITKAPLTITAKSYTRKQGESNPTFDVTYSGFKNGENASVLSRQPTCITTAVSSSPPGTYDIIVSGASATNYDISYVKGMLTVTQADAVIVTAKSYTREYGEENPVFDYTTSGGSLNGTPTIICSATRTSPVGTYPIKITQGSGRNYNVTYVDGTLTITKAPLIITAKSYKREEGTANPTLEATYSGFKNGETESVLSKIPTLTTTATIDSKPGDYPITASGAEARNYQISYMSGKLTVTEKNEVKFTSQGVSYIGTNATRTAEIEVVASDITELEIPQSVINDGKTYQVTSVSNGALSNRKFNYVSLPSTITSLNANTFYNSVLGALVWKADASLSSNVFSYMAMPTLSNFLLYVNSKSYAPSNVTNVVVGNTASNIVLVDGTNTWFYCPMAFTAQSVTYTHHYGMLTGGNGKGWETISLPYDVQKIEHKSKGVLTPFVLYNDMMTQRPFWLYEFGSNGFRKTDVIKANTPYIIAMPNDSKYDEEYILVGDVTFSATNAQIHKTESLVMPSSNDKTFVPAFTVVDSSSSVYALNVNNNMASYAGSYDAGSRFISNLRDVYPFEAYMTTSSSSARTLGIDFADGTTGIDEIPMAGNGERVKVYSLSGLLLIDSEQSEWESLWQQLPSGVYIVNGKKTIK